MHKSTSIILAWVELEVVFHVCVWFKCTVSQGIFLNSIFLEIPFWWLVAMWWPMSPSFWWSGEIQNDFLCVHDFSSLDIIYLFKCNPLWTALVSLGTPYCPVSENIICTRAAGRLQLLKKNMCQIVSVNIASNTRMSETKTTLSLPFVD